MTQACTDDIARINTSVTQLSHMNDMSVRDVFALVILMGLYLSTASGHQKAYKELLAYIDAGNALTLVERELKWRDRGMSEDTRVYASMLVRHNIVPEQLLFEAGCPDYQDDRAFPILAQAAENLMRVGYDSTDDKDT